MDLRRLEIFLAVVDEGGFTAAADELDISQPAVSQAVRELESELGTALFHRLGRRTALTPAGEALVAPARQTWRDLDIGRRAVEGVAGMEHGRLDLACLPTLAVAPLAPIVGAFRARYPGMTIRLSDPAGTAELLEMVQSGRAEVGLVEHLEAEGLESVRLSTQEFAVVLPPGSDAPNPLPMQQLAALPLVATPRGSSARGLLDDALARADAFATVVVEAAQREALLPLIAAGAGAGLLPRPLAAIAEGLGCVVVEPDPPVRRDVAIVHRRGPLTPGAARFVELARTLAA